MYYLRTKAARDAIKFTATKEAKAEPVLEAAVVAAPVVAQVATEQVLSPVAVSDADTENMTEEEFLAAAKQCSIDNPDDCEMCSG